MTKKRKVIICKHCGRKFYDSSDDKRASGKKGPTAEKRFRGHILFANLYAPKGHRVEGEEFQQAYEQWMEVTWEEVPDEPTREELIEKYKGFAKERREWAEKMDARGDIPSRDYALETAKIHDLYVEMFSTASEFEHKFCSECMVYTYHFDGKCFRHEIMGD